MSNARQATTAGSTGEQFEYAYDAVGNRTAVTSTTPVSHGRAYTYAWSARGHMLAEWTQGYPMRTFAYDGAAQMVEATVFWGESEAEGNRPVLSMQTVALNFGL